MAQVATMPTPLSSPNAHQATRRDVPFQHQPTYITLTRMLVRFQHIILLLPPTASLTPFQEQIQRELHSPLPYFRTKWLHNIEHARTLLLELEHAAQSIKVQRVKRDVVHDLAEKRKVIKKLRVRIEEIGRLVDAGGDHAWKHVAEGQGETVEQLLGRPPLSTEKPRGQATTQDKLLANGRPVTAVEEETDHPNPAPLDPVAPILIREPDSPSTPDKASLLTLRKRRGGLNEPTSPSTSTSGFTALPQTETRLLTSSRTHESLTTSLLTLAAQLKQQTRHFHASLQTDTGLLDRVLDGLDANVTGMDAASQRIGTLRRMSEGTGWWGRIMLYAWIGGLWVVAVLLVFVGPKLRF